MAVGAMVFLLAVFASVATLSRTARVSLVLDTPTAGPARVSWVLPGSHLWDGGVRAGAPVLAIDGHSVTPRDSGLWSGTSIVLRTPGGALRTLSATQLLTRSDTWWLLVSSPWFLVLGMLVCSRTPQQPLAASAYALFASAAVALALAPAADGDNLFALVAEFVAVVLFTAAFGYFFLIFPQPQGVWLRRWLFGPPVIVLVVYFSSILLWPDLSNLAFALRLLLMLTYLLLGAGLLVLSFAGTHDRAVRRGIAVLCGSTLAAISPSTGLYMAPVMLHRAPIVSPERASLALVLLPAGFA